ncbi:MAG: hypothetical protein ACRD4R_15145 [Candidatus Acidiferrales bacterium]
MIQLRAVAWNGEFGGVANPYVGVGGLAEAAEQLSGFPRDPSDTRQITFGAFGPKTAVGGISMRFFCTDKAGHARVEVKIESDRLNDERPQSVTLWLAVEASAIDRFVHDLRHLESERPGTACLSA